PGHRLAATGQEGFIQVYALATGAPHGAGGAQRPQVKAGTHAIGAPELDVISVVMGLHQRAGMVRVPSVDAIVQAGTGCRPKAPEPGTVAADAPITVQLHQTAKLAVGGGVKTMLHRSHRQGS